MNAEQLRELRFMANCHNKAPLWSEFNRQAIADVLAEVASLTAERDALAAENAKAKAALIAAAQLQREANARADAIAAELATVREELAEVYHQLETHELNA